MRTLDIPLSKIDGLNVFTVLKNLTSVLCRVPFKMSPFLRMSFFSIVFHSSVHIFLKIGVDSFLLVIKNNELVAVFCSKTNECEYLGS